MDARERIAALAAASERIAAAGRPRAPLGEAVAGRERRAEALSEAARVDAGRALDDVVIAIRPRFVPIKRRVVRPDDLLALDLTFENMRMLRAGRGGLARLSRRFASRPAVMIVELQGQAAGERDFDEAVGDRPAETAPAIVRARLAGPSRLAFRMPPEVQALEFSLEAVLDACRRWPMQLDGLARPDTIRIAPGLAAEIGELTAVSRPSAAVGASLSPVAEGVEALLQESGERRVARKVTRAARRAGSAGRRGRRRTPDAEAVFARAVRGIQDAELRAAARVLFDAERTVTAARVADRGGRRARSAFEATLLDIGPLVALLLRPHLPASNVTSIEAPYRLFMTPLASSAWAHALRPVEGGGRTELWHTRLAPASGGLADESAEAPNRVRYVWSHDYDPDKSGNGYSAPLTGLSSTSPEPRDRDEIVRLTSGYDEADAGSAYDPRTLGAQEVMLSTLGASLDLEGAWDPLPDFVNVSAWRHVSNWGRDNYVRVVKEGFLLPFGHRAAKIDVTERKFEDAAGGGRSAILRKRTFLVLRERVKRFGASGMPKGGRKFPFREVEVLTRVTPNIDEGPVDPSAPSAPPVGDAFVPTLGSTDFQFEVRLTDLGGRVVALSMPMTFILTSANQDAGDAATVRSAFNRAGAPMTGRRTVGLGGAAVQYAPVPAGADGGDVALPSETVELRLANSTASFAKARARHVPEVHEATVIVPALKKLAPGGEVDQFRRVAFHGPYLAGGYGGNNAAALFLDLVETLDLEFGPGRLSENAGGFFEPNMGVEALSALRGAVGDATNAALGDFVPEDYFGDARLIGGILIRDLLEGVVTSLVGDDAPEFVSVDVGTPPTHAEARLTWNTEISRALPLFKPNAGGDATVFDLEVLSKVPFDGTPPETTVDTTLTNFKVDMFGLIILWFDQLQFKKEPGKKADVNPDLHPTDAVVFGGPLEFVNKLSDLIPDAGFSDPPVLDISPTGIVAGYELEIPDVNVGALLLSNMALGARLRLPFDGDPVSVRFNFAEREDPFNLTISLLGGGGFFALAVQSTGVREVEAALEFGAAIAFDIGVASGGVYVKAGIYFHWMEDASGQTVELTGYVEMGGELSVLGLIRVSVTFHLALSYHKSGGTAELRGQATLTIEIEILFFSTSVKLKVERRFGGSPADPKFIDFIPDQQTWDRYAAAFA
ncbi:MAG: hypothetical protein AAF763_03045 [Pseudomonadota bacterium]